ncbi:hypothetical protein ABRY23_12300 [Melioribacteraceae bacterium 4301-Me]|uniref:hypothetical protein n=1 Tax=Pyranulibacter aquaticus TaxID=3163344 RepID=UPI00359AE642
MENNFNEPVYLEIISNSSSPKKNVIKKNEATIAGNTKITVDEEPHENVKIILKKDSDDVLKEIKFICSCGQTKTITLDYSE